jgi:hypothetical protein
MMDQYKNGEKVHLEGQIRGGIWRPLGSWSQLG